MRWHLRCTFQLFLFGLCTPSRPFIKKFIRKNKNRLHGDHFRITVEPVIVKRYRKTLANRGFCKKKLDTRFDTHCIKTGVQLWRRRRDLNPRYPFGVYTISNRARSASYATSPFHCPHNPGLNRKWRRLLSAISLVIIHHVAKKVKCSFDFF